jgi:RNA polymerase primary sigma factor
MTMNIEQMYFKDVNFYRVLTEDEERDIVHRIQKNDQHALNKLIAGNLRFVVSVARRFQGKGLSLLELINEGNLGLYKAAKRFSEDKKVKFISYAVWWIRQAIQKAIFEQADLIKIPPNKLAIINRFKRRVDKFGGNVERTLEEPEFKGMRLEILEILGKLAPVSLDAPLGEHSDNSDAVNSLMDLIGEDAKQLEDLERKDLKAIVNGILAKLAKREELILRMYYGIDFDREYTLEEIGQKLKLTRERVRQVKNKALRKLLRSRQLQDQLLQEASADDSSSLVRNKKISEE